MEEMLLTQEMIDQYMVYLMKEEKSRFTVEKYYRDIQHFYVYLSEDKLVSKEKAIHYKEWLLQTYQISSVNSMIVAMNGLFKYLGWGTFRVKTCRCQRSLVCDSDKSLTREEYIRLVQEAQKKGKVRLCLILQTICATGIRIGELVFVTKESVTDGKAQVRLKGKNRTVIFPGELQKKLMDYCTANKISSGPVFVTRNGKSVNRSNLWAEMKKLCQDSDIDSHKVFPHNLRHLFARTYYKQYKDIVYLADILGHSNINTTRIYTSVSQKEHEQVLNHLQLLI